MWFTGKLRHDQRGTGSIIGAVFIFLILFSGYMFYALQVNVENEYNETLQDMQQLDLKRSRENIEFVTVRFDDGKLNITVRNTGSYQAHLIWLGIFDGTVTPSSQEYYEIDFYVNPSETVTNVGNNTIPNFKNETRTIQILTELGNIFSCSYPISEKGGEYDFVDAVGDPPAMGTHSFFSAMQSGPDGVMDTLTEGIGVSKEDYVDVFPSGIGTHSNQTAQQDGPNGVYDTLTEAASPAIQYYYPSGYNLVGSTTYDSGSLNDLTSNNSMYMTFNSYLSATSAMTLYAHQETTIIGGTTYRLQKLDSADAAGTSLSASMAATGRQLFGKFVYPLTGMSSIPASIWTMYYRGWQDATPSIAYDAQSSMVQTTIAFSISWSHTTGTGSNRLLLVALSVHVATGAPTTVSSVTYGGVPLTQVTTALYSATNPQVRTYIFQLVNPTSGTNTITVTFAAATLSVAGAATYSGVDQTNPIQTSNTAIGSGTTPLVSVTVTGSGRRLFGHLGGHRTTPPTAWTITEGPGQTQRWAQTGQLYKGVGSDKVVSAGSQSMSWTLSRTASYVASAVVINPATPPVGHFDVDILIRQSDGTIRATLATNVADSGYLTTTPATLSGTYSFANYTVFDQTDYLEIDYYIEVTTALSGISAYLRIDDNTLAVADQTRATNILQPSEYTVEVEFTGSSDNQSWSQIVWTVDSQFTAPNVTTTLQLWNYYTGSYPTSGDGYQSYTSSSIQGTDETRTQTITSNPTYFRDSSGNWKLKIKGVKTTNSQFSWKGDFIEYQDQYPIYQLNLEEQFTDCDYSQTNADLCIYTQALSSESLMVDVWSESASAWITVISSLQPNTWNNVTVASYLTGQTLRIRFWTGIDTGDTTQDSWQIDSTLLRIWSPNYRLDLEVQWTNADYGEAYEWLCIFGGNMSSEDLSVDVWNGASWVTIIANLKSGWNSVDVSSYLVSSNFRIRFRDSIKAGDVVQDSWEIDATFLHVWS